MTERAWQLAMVGHGLEHVTAGAQADMAPLLDLVPSINHLTVQTDAGTIHIARDWPSDRMEEADDLTNRIAAPGISAVVIAGKGNPRGGYSPPVIGGRRIPTSNEPESRRVFPKRGMSESMAAGWSAWPWKQR